MEPKLDITKILDLLPHRYPFLLVDRVIEIEERKKIVAIKNVTYNEPFFTGHFPGTPIMPGVLIVEAMAQAGGLLLLVNADMEINEDKIVYFMAIDKVKFRHPVTPGDQLRLEIRVLRAGSKICKFEGQGYVSNTLVAEGVLTAMLADKK